MATQLAPYSKRVIPVLRPALPAAGEILPFLKRIDEGRWYSNAGPLVAELERSLSDRLGFLNPGVVTAANATAGITVALLAREIPAGSVCLMPSWTFAATPHAARAAGLTPWFHDVDRGSWALNPDEVRESLKSSSLPVRSVIVVAPFGAPLDLDAWQDFEDRTGVAVVVDAAASFDSVQAHRIPCVVSLHATKILGAGEGGFVATTDRQLLERVRACCNFGFHGSRLAQLPSLNAKMSEYHAAVALASLAAWSRTRRLQVRITEWYREGIGQMDNLSLQPDYGNGWVSSTTSVLLPAGSTVARTAQQLGLLGIETRAWWGEGCHGQPAFLDCPRGSLTVTEDLGARVLGLPHYPDISKDDVGTALAGLSEVLSEPRDHLNCAKSAPPATNAVVSSLSDRRRNSSAAVLTPSPKGQQ